jgi:hypothetical protein
MQSQIKTVREWLSEKFGTNVTKVASENLSAEEFNSFENSGAAIQQQLADLATITASNEQLTAANQQLTEQLSAEKTSNQGLTQQLATASADLLKYKELYEKDANIGTGLPKGDASNSDEATKQLNSKIENLPVGHPDRVAMESFLDAQKSKNAK